MWHPRPSWPSEKNKASYIKVVDAWILFLIISGSFYLFPHFFLQLTAFLSRIPMRSYLKTPVWFLG